MPLSKGARGRPARAACLKRRQRFTALMRSKGARRLLANRARKPVLHFFPEQALFFAKISCE
jgi:hypothetical protein